MDLLEHLFHYLQVNRTRDVSEYHEKDKWLNESIFNDFRIIIFLIMILGAYNLSLSRIWKKYCGHVAHRPVMATQLAMDHVLSGHKKQGSSLKILIRKQHHLRTTTGFSASPVGTAILLGLIISFNSFLFLKGKMLFLGPILVYPKSIHFFFWPEGTY